MLTTGLNKNYATPQIPVSPEVTRSPVNGDVYMILQADENSARIKVRMSLEEALILGRELIAKASE